jgi:predicted dehydrogenase
MSKTKLGFIGCGFMGQLAHMQNYAQIEDCEIVALAESKQALAARVAAAYGIPRVYSDYRQLLADPQIEAVVAAQPFTNHVNVVPEVLAAGKHLLTEKPLCVYAENGHKLAEAARKANKIHMVGYHKRSDLATEHAMQVIGEWRRSGKMGKMKYVRVTMPPGDWVGGSRKPFATGETAPEFVPEAAPAGVGEAMAAAYVSFVNYYIHQVNLMRFLFGEDYKLTFADNAGILLVAESAGGVTGVIEMASFTTTDDWQEQALICFDKGWIRIDLPAPLASQQAGKVTIFDNSGATGIMTSPRLPNEHAMLNQARNFIKAVRGEKTAPCVSAEAVKDLEIAMDYIKSHNQYI